jgi:hypothetical protein
LAGKSKRKMPGSILQAKHFLSQVRDFQSYKNIQKIREEIPLNEETTLKIE